MARLIRDVMTRDPRTIDASASAQEAAALMRDHDIGVVLVTSGGELQGLLTDRDIVIRGLAEGLDVQSATAGQLASQRLVTIDPDQSLEDAGRLMADHQVRRLPVCEEDVRLVCILS